MVLRHGSWRIYILNRALLSWIEQLNGLRMVLHSSLMAVQVTSIGFIIDGFKVSVGTDLGKLAVVFLLPITSHLDYCKAFYPELF